MMVGLHQPEEEEEENLTLGRKRAASSAFVPIIRGNFIGCLSTTTSLSFVQHTYYKKMQPANTFSTVQQKTIIWKFVKNQKSKQCILTFHVGRFSPFLQATKALRVSRRIDLLFLRPRHQMGVGESAPSPGSLYSRERPGTHCTGGWVGPRTGLDGRKISSSLGFYPGPSSSQSVAIPTELPGPHLACLLHK